MCGSKKKTTDTFSKIALESHPAFCWTLANLGLEELTCKAEGCKRKPSLSKAQSRIVAKQTQKNISNSYQATFAVLHPREVTMLQSLWAEQEQKYLLLLSPPIETGEILQKCFPPPKCSITDTSWSSQLQGWVRQELLRIQSLRGSIHSSFALVIWVQPMRNGLIDCRLPKSTPSANPHNRAPVPTWTWFPSVAAGVWRWTCTNVWEE